ncbi:MAG TPA: methylmalonyl Co-A mutase-associated GTPase MeaB [Planctomycetes bacterium]|nr:methylmalonyl Co-A mutase-associated GTPase MeaB [Planctomycetota bacterium]
MTLSAADLRDRVLAGDRRAVARAITVLERGGDDGAALHALLYPHAGRALRLGVTGPPGAGKSTLVDRLARELHGDFSRLAVLAVDPSSPVTHGALLGDRIRMGALQELPGVFVRSMASRGLLGGLGPAALEVMDGLDAAGFDLVLVETVGVGQSELDVAFAADITLVVVAPGAGDGIQALKAGLLEMADIVCVNKSDLGGAETVRNDLMAAFELSSARSEKAPAILLASSKTGEGVGALAASVRELAGDEDFRIRFGERRRRAAQRRIVGGLQREAGHAAERVLESDPVLVTSVVDGLMTPRAASHEVFRRILKGETS